MKRLISIVAVFAVVFIWLAGCGRPLRNSHKAELEVAALEKRIKPVPDYIAGAWVERGEETTWRMYIEPNGIVSSAVIPLMTTVLRPHQTTKREMIDGSFSDFTAGDMFAEYDPLTRELFVFIELKEFQVRIQDVRTGGHVVYRFTGPVSEDSKVWKPDYINIPDYGPEFPIDYNDIEPLHPIFEKFEEK